jgi:hypothetical protein
MTDQTRSTADEEIMRLATADDESGEAKPEARADDTLELGSEEAPELKDDEQPEGEKKRSRPWSQRVDILTARLRDAERRAAEAESRSAPAPAKADEPAAPDPNDAKYEFGEADPQYIKDSALFEVRKEIADERRKEREAAEAQGKQSALAGQIGADMERIEKAGTEKYEDFEEKIAAALEAREGQPLNPVVSMATATSPVGHDIAYRLATDEAVQERFDSEVANAMGQIQQMQKQGITPDIRVFSRAALMFGEVEGEYLPPDHDDADLDLNDPLDMMRMNGRMKARLAGKGGQSPVERKQTKAPNPAEHRARGGTGQFEVGDDTEDFAAFERKYMGKKK